MFVIVGDEMKGAHNVWEESIDVLVLVVPTVKFFTSLPLQLVEILLFVTRSFFFNSINGLRRVAIRNLGRK